MPLSLVEVNESFLDGTLEAAITVFTAAEEKERARQQVTRTRFLSYPLLLAWVCLVFGAGDWFGSVHELYPEG